MKFVKSFSFLLLISFSFLISCGDSTLPKNDALVYIPENTASVTSVNLKRLMEKADFESVKQMEFYQELIDEASRSKDPIFAEILKSPELSGVDLEKNIYINTALHPKNPENVFASAILSLNNAADFEKLVKTEIKEKDGYKLVNIDNNIKLAWNDQIAVLGGTNAGEGWANEKIAEIFVTKKETSIASNKDIKGAISTNHDFSSWVSSNSLANNREAGLALSMLQIPAEALKDNFIHGSFDFEDGAIASKSKFLFNDELGKEFFGRFLKDETSTDFSEHVPSDNLVFAASGAIDFKGIDQFLSVRPQAKGYIDYMLKEWDLDMKDIIETFGGDVLVAGTGSEDIGNGSAFFVTNVKNTEKLNTFIQLAMENNILMELDKGYYKITAVGVPGFSFSQGGKSYGKVLLKDGLLFVSSDELILDQIKNGTFNGGGAGAKKAIDVLKNTTLAGFFDIDAVKELTAELDHIQFENMELKVKGNEADFRMNMENKEMNSLKAIFQMINKSYLESKGEEAM